MYFDKKDKIIITLSFYISISLIFNFVFIGGLSNYFRFPESGINYWSVFIDRYYRIKCIDDDIFAFGTYDDDIHLAKFNSSGNILWEKTWNMTYDPVIFNVYSDSNDGILLAVDSGVDNKFTIFKYSNAGILMWFYTLNFSDYHGVSSISLDSEDSILISSSGRNYTVDQSKHYLVKLNKSGYRLWKQELNVSYSILQIDSKNNIYGFGKDLNGTSSLIKYNSSGVKQWQIEVSEYVHSRFMGIDSKDNIYLSGYFTPINNSMQWITKLNNSGNVLNHIQFDSYFFDKFVLSFDKIYFYDDIYPYLMRFDTNLNLEWNYSLDKETSSSFGYKTYIGFDSQQNVIFLNNNYRSGTSYQEDILIMTLNTTNGDISYFYWGSSQRDRFSDIDIDYLGNIYMVCFIQYRNPWNEKISQRVLVKNPEANSGPPAYDWGLDYREIYVFSLIGFMSLVSTILSISIVKPKLKRQ